jgi:subtilisin family serine protease
LGAAVVPADVLVYRGANVAAVAQALEHLGAQITGWAGTDPAFDALGVLVPGSRFQEIARLSGVYSIQPVPLDGGLRSEMSNQVNAGNYNASNLAYPGYLDWLAAVGVNGSGVVVANVDSGVDTSHPDLVGRFISCSGTTCGGSSSSSHGTHTAGIMAADGSSGVLDSYGFLRGLGMAPGANLVEQVYSPFYTDPGGMLLLMTESYRNGASVSGNSWGPAGSPQGYDDDTRQVDVGVRDADPALAGNQAFNYVLSIMNGNGGTSSQGTPDEAKNIFTIGSTKLQDSSGAQLTSIDDISANSAHGPALDGRKIPHLVAPGCEVDSTVPVSYDLMCGTSMASPHVTGAVALFIEYYRGLFGIDPSPALVKAAFLPVAHDLAGHLDADNGVMGHPFDSKQGWGRMDTAAVISPTWEVHYFDNPVVFDNTGEEWLQQLSPADPSRPMRLMLVWTDAPGHGLGGSTPAWNNDLNLLVETGGNTYLGNNFGTTGWSQPGGSPDGKNNTEGVFLAVGVSEITARVVAANLSSDGIPNYGDGTDQDFALVCYNCSLGPDFSLGITPADQVVCAPQAAVYDLELGSVLGFNQPVTLTVQGVPGGSTAQFDANPVLPPATSVLTIANPVTAVPGRYLLDVIGSAASTAHTETVGLDLYTALPGTPTLLYPASEATNVPPRPLFAWQATQGQVYTLQVATDPDFMNLVLALGGLTEPFYSPVVDLSLNSVYYWRVQAQNVCGSSVVSVVSRFLTAPPQGDCALGRVPSVLLAEGFETGAPGWTHSGTGDTWGASTMRKHAGAYAFKATDVAVVSDQRLVSPPVTLPVGSGPLTLRYWDYQYLQNRSGGCYDGGILEVSADSGASWTQLETELLTNPYDGPLATGSSNPLAGLSAWCGAPQTWFASLVNLDAWAGQTIQLRYRLGTNSTMGMDGWYLDDVSVQACALASTLGPASQQLGQPGHSTWHTFTLTNQGPSDTYTLALSSFTWPTSLEGSTQVVVGQGETVTVTVRVDLPLMAVGSDNFTLTATSATIPGSILTASGTTEVGNVPIFVPLVIGNR